MTAKGTFGTTAREASELFADYLEGDMSRPALALSAGSLDPAARNAIEKSLDALGYGSADGGDACTYVTLTPHDADAEGSDIPLDPQATFLLVEGRDPLFVICADHTATELLGRAYRVELPADASTRAFGRQTATFADLPGLLQSQEGKQKAWRILKSFSRG